MTANSLGTCEPASTLRSQAVETHCKQSDPKDKELNAERPAPKSKCRDASVEPELANTCYNTARMQLPPREAFRSVPTPVDARYQEMRAAKLTVDGKQSIRIRKTAEANNTALSPDNALLIPCASFSTVSRTINFLFKVLFIFPSRYLFAIGLVPIFSFRRSLPPILGWIPNQPDS